MSASEVLAELRQCGAEVIIAGDAVKLRIGSVNLAPELLDAARACKGEIRQLLQAEADDAYRERAAICEHDGGLSPAHAEVLAALHQVAPANVIDAAARFLDRHHISTGRHGGRGRGQHS